MVQSSIQARIIQVLMVPEGIRRSRQEIAKLTGISSATVYRALDNGIAGVVKDKGEKRDSITRPAELYYWDSAVIMEAQRAKENVIQMPIKNNSTALRVTDIAGIPKEAMEGITQSMQRPSPDELDVLRRLERGIRFMYEDMQNGLGHEGLRISLINYGGLIMQLCIDMGVQSEEPIAPQANQKDSDKS